MAVIESTGDGYALYNGVKLPKLSDVEIENDMFDGELPYQFVFRNDSNDFYVFFSEKPFQVEYDSFNTFGVYTLYDWYWDSENLILNGSVYGTACEFWISDYEPIWSNHDIINIDDGDSVYFPASEDPIPLDGMNVIEWDGDTTPSWDFDPGSAGVWDHGDGTIRLAPYTEVLNAIAVIGGEVYTYNYIDQGCWEVYESFEAYEECDYERRGAYADRRYGTCAVDKYYDYSVLTSLIAYTPIEEEPKKATITYHTEHGTAPEPYTVVLDSYGEYPWDDSMFPILTADGYIFKGWSMSEDEMSEPTGMINGDVDLYAIWEKSTVDYTITYQTEHGIAPASKTMTVNEGESYTLTEEDLPVLSADGYIFGGWSVNGKVISVGYTISDDIILTALWTEEVYVPDKIYSPLVRISKLTPTIEQMSSCKVIVDSGDTTIECLYASHMDYVTCYSITYGNKNNNITIVVVTEVGNCEELRLSFPKTGIYVPDYGRDGISMNYTLEEYTTYENVLTSYDGYILKDSDGLYLSFKEDE